MHPDHARTRSPGDALARPPCAAPLAALLLLLPVTACGAIGENPLGGPCDVRGQRGAEVEAGDAEVVRVTVGAGSLEVRGRDDLDRVRVAGEACASSGELLEGIGLEARRDGNRVVVESRMPETSLGEQARLDLVLEVPAALVAEIHDGSGSITVSDLAGLRIDDGSGSLEVARIDGPVRITDGSGSVEVSEVRGPVRVDDGSGSLTIRSVEGDVRVEDGSGGLTVRQVRGNVAIDDGSGGIHVRDVTGDLRVGDAGSGTVEIEGIAGQVSVEE